MIGYLTGIPQIYSDHLILMTGGVGYLVEVSNATLSTCSNTDAEIALFIHTHVKEDALQLYGFLSQQEKRIFLLLLDVSGVGPKTALTISERGAPAIINAVQNANVEFFSSIPRVGKKTAQKIIIELKSKLGSLKELDLTPLSQQEIELTEALQALGFDESSIQSVVKDLSMRNLSLEEAVKTAIKQLG